MSFWTNIDEHGGGWRYDMGEKQAGDRDLCVGMGVLCEIGRRMESGRWGFLVASTLEYVYETERVSERWQFGMMILMYTWVPNPHSNWFAQHISKPLPWWDLVPRSGSLEGLQAIFDSSQDGLVSLQAQLEALTCCQRSQSPITVSKGIPEGYCFRLVKCQN